MIFRAFQLYLIAILLLFATPISADPLDTLRPEHPRVLATAEDFDRIAKLIETDPLAKRWYEQLTERAQQMLDQPAPKYELRDGRRLLYVSREVLARVKVLAMLDRLSPNDTYRDRVWVDIQAVAAFPNRHPDHFLDVAEMALAVALAYDWLYDRWIPEQRKVMRDALIKHGLEPGLKAYRTNAWWTRTHINWNQVCNGGLIAAALAVADDEPEMASQMITLGVEALKIPLSRYAPDGGYEEGPGYWAYGTIYNVIAIASLESGLGTDFGLSKSPGFGKTASFPVQMIGSSDTFFNFGDNKERVSASPALLWFAKRFADELDLDFVTAPRHARFMLDRFKPSPLALLWYHPSLQDEQFGPDLKAVYPSVSVATMRSGWGSASTFVGLKGGRVHVGHSQMDLGSFVLDHDGVRWFIDLGADNYNLPGYFAATQGGKRWHYYRNRAEGHNTLVINPGKDGGQRYGVHTDVRAALTTPDHKSDWSIDIDLSAVYDNAKVQRHIAYVPGSNDYTVLTDTVALEQPGEVWWFAHTRASVKLSDDGRSATLEQDGKTMHAKLVSPKNAKFGVMDARPLPTSPDPSGQNPNNGAVLSNKAKGANFSVRGTVPVFGDPDPSNAVRKLAIHMQGVEAAEIKVVFTPGK